MNGSNPIDSQWPHGKLLGTNLPSPTSGKRYIITGFVEQSFIDRHKGHRGSRPVLHCIALTIIRLNVCAFVSEC